MAGRKLATYVYVEGVAYGPDDDVPADVAKQITNEKAWADKPAAEDKTPAKKSAASKK